MKRPDPAAMALWSAFLKAHSRVVDKMERDLVCERELSLAWYEVLYWLAQAPGGALRMQNLARTVLVSKSGLTRLVERMEDAGLVRREACPSDRRGTLAVITDLGRRTLRRAAPVHVRGIQEHFVDRIDASDVAALRKALDSLAAES